MSTLKIIFIIIMLGTRVDDVILLEKTRAGFRIWKTQAGGWR